MGVEAGSMWRHPSGGHGQMCKHTQDRHNGRHGQSKKMWVLWTQVGSQVCEWMAWRGITRGRMKGPGAVWSVCTDIVGPAMQGGSRGPA